MKNKILSYLLGCILVLSMWFISSYVYAQWTDCITMCTERTQREEVVYDQCVNDCYSAEQQQQQQQQQQTKECKDWCCGIKLNTNFPGVWTCISFGKNGNTNPTNVFQKTIWTFTKLIMSIILVVCFVMIIIAWIMRAWAWEDSSQKTKAKKLIERVAITILLIWFSWVILRIINPNFFG